MKVLHIFNEIKYSGAEIMYANAAPIFTKNSIEIYAFATGKNIGDFEPVFRKQGIKVWHRPMPGNTQYIELIKFINKSVRFVRENEISVIHIHRSDAKWLFALIAKLVGVKSIYTAHNVFKNRKLTWFRAYLVRLTARKFFGLQFQTIGQSVYDNELNYYKTPSVRVNNWFDGTKFFPSVSTIEKYGLRDKMGIGRDKFVLISTGGCTHVKNHHAILHAIAMLPNSYEITYLHLGCGKTTEEEKELADKLGITKCVHFLGNKTNVREYLIASDVYLMPSKFEGLSIASIEAMACGVPSILYNSPGLRDLIENNNNGQLIQPEAKALSEGINWVLKNPAAAKQKAENALQFVNKEFSIERNVDSIIRLYKRDIK